MRRSFVISGFVFLLLALCVPHTLLARDMIIQEWRVDDQGMIESVAADGSVIKMTAPTIPPEGFKAHLSPNGYWEIANTKESIRFYMKSVKEFKSETKSVCDEGGGSSYTGRQVYGAGGCLK